MTLVAAQKTDNGILSISDTKLTFEDSRAENPYYGALKSHIIGLGQSLHFAGNPYWAAQALSQITERFGKIDASHFEEVTGLLLELNRQSSGDTDFILVDSNQCRISRICDASCIEDCERAYIGNPEAIEAFSAAYEDAKSSSTEDDGEPRYRDFSAMSKAFKEVIANGNVPSVDGFDVSIMQENDCLAYQIKVEVVMGHMNLKIGPGEARTIPFGNAAIGSHSVNFLCAKAGDWPQCLGVHLYFGNIGILWGPSHHIRPIVITECSHNVLVEIAKQEFGASILGVMIS